MRPPPRLALAALSLIALALLPLARGPWRGSELLVANASALDPGRRLTVWSGPARAGPEPVAWYSTAPPVERRYVRILPSLLVSAEIALFGPRAWALRLVTLALHLVSCWLGLRLLARFTGDAEKAAAIVVLLGVHGAAFEVVGWESCQAIAVAAVLSLAAAALLLESREASGGAGRSASLLAAAAVAACLLAMTSYEAVIGLPLALTVLDREHARSGPGGNVASGRPRLALAAALLALYPIYLALQWLAARGGTHASYRAAPSEALRTAAVDLARYAGETLLYLPVGDLVAPGALAATGTVALSGAALAMMRPGWRRLGGGGVALYLLFLAPPLLARATVSVLNRPSLRQLYLPLLGVALLLALVPGPMSRRRWAAVLAAVVLSASASLAAFVRRAPPEGYARVRAATRRELATLDPHRPVLIVGRARCERRHGDVEYRVEVDAGAREVVQLLPLDRQGGLPELRLATEHTLVARARSGFAIDVDAVAPGRGRERVRRRPPPLVRTGSQRLPFGRVEVVEADAGAIRELAVTFDRPVREHSVLLLDGCRDARRYDAAAPAEPSAAVRAPASTE